jgi:DNA-binding FadR family transcriptional regulator
MDTLSSPDTIFAPVISPTAFEETVDRLGTAIKLGLLPPGSRLPAERELCTRLGIARSTLRQALSALSDSGHLRAVRGRGGGTFVAERPPEATPPTEEEVAGWRDACDARLAVEVGVAVLAAERATDSQIDGLQALSEEMEGLLDDFPAYRAADVRFHVGLARSTGSVRLEQALTEAQGEMSDLISHIAHPPSVLRSSNRQHAAIVKAVRDRDGAAAAACMAAHLQGTEHVLAGLLP